MVLLDLLFVSLTLILFLIRGLRPREGEKIS